MNASVGKIKKYGLKFPADSDDAQIERVMLQNGGKWQEGSKMYGEGLEFHFKEYWKQLWPEDFQTWWTDLMLHEIIHNQFTAIAGPASGGKTAIVSRIAMMDWSLFPECTTVMVSSTTMDDVKNRIYAEIQKIWNAAKEGHDWFPGFPIDSRCVITESEAQADVARDIRNSIVGIPCKTSTGRFQGMSRFGGRKNRRVWCVGDEFQFMELSILEAQNNLVSNGPNLVPGLVRHTGDSEEGKPLRGYKCVFIGNPNPSRPGNPLDVVCEPKLGFPSIPEDGKTKVWDCKKLANHPVQCRCINLDGADSPNSAYPVDRPRWVHMAGPHKLALYTEGSESYWSQGRGVFKFGLATFKIITKEVCDTGHAFDAAQWKGTSRIKVGMLDASYGGGDRCALGWLEFGECVDGTTRIQFHPHWLIPITIQRDMTPEDQIAVFCRDKMEEVHVPPENFFFDGRGSLAMKLASNWSSKVNAIEFGGSPTARIAGPDIYTLDPRTKQRRLKLAHEHYSKFVTELWWSFRYAIDADQIRGLELDVCLDACPREWYKVAGDKIEAETKRDMKKRTGLSPDLADMAVVGVEGARRLGFQIARLAAEISEDESNDWIADDLAEQDSILKSALLEHA